MMKKGINSSMKKAFYGLDWTICFLWAIGVVVVGYGWFPYFPVNLVALMVLFRIVCSFALYKGEKKAWASGLVALALMALKWLMDADVHMWILTSKAYAMMAMETDKPREEVFPWVLKVWLGLFPVVAYAVNAMRKGGMVDNLTWKEAMGLLLWTDRRAKTYCALLLVALFALYFGLALYDRACALACVVAPMVSLYLLQRLRGVAMRKLWVVAVAMITFFLSQFEAGGGACGDARSQSLCDGLCLWWTPQEREGPAFLCSRCGLSGCIAALHGYWQQSLLLPGCCQGVPSAP